MIDSARVRERMEVVHLNQSELARRVGVTQGAIAKIANKNPNGSSHLHRIARELRTTPAYLTGETDDPNQDAPDVAPMTPQQRELLDSFDIMTDADRRALLQIARSMANHPAQGTIQAPALPYRQSSDGEE